MDLSTNTSLAGLAEAIRALQIAAQRLECPIYLAGALARDLWLAFGSNIDTQRKTEDVDFAVKCTDWSTFENLAKALQYEGFLRNSDVPHRFEHSTGTLIDLIPFGGIEDSNHRLVWPPDGDHVMNLTGFGEIVGDARPVVLPGGVTVEVVSLAALALLKLLAWEDRGHGRGTHKDATDLELIARHYSKARLPNIEIEVEIELLKANDFDDKLASAQLLGADMAQIGSDELHAAVLQVLERESDPQGTLAFAQATGAYEASRAVALMSALLRGYTGS